MLPTDQRIEQAFQEYDRLATLNNFKVACCLGIVLMPAGVVLDRFVYGAHPELVRQFLELRILSSIVIGVFLAALWPLAPLAKKYYRFLGVALAMLPSSFISLMVYLAPDGASSPYYAGLNLVVLVVGFVMHWTFRESLIAVTLVILMYLAACLGNGTGFGSGVFVNNIYFLVLTGTIVSTGRFFHSRLREGEFVAQYRLKETYKKLQELDEVKSRFFANISHELRTPLTLLLAPLKALSSRLGRSIDEETRELLKTMDSNGMRLLKLINDLLDLVRLESGRMEVKREPLEVAEFIKGLASATRQFADKKGIRLEATADPQLGVISADRDKLEKILLNLVFNALKFTPSGGEVLLRAVKQDNDFVLIVSDTGMGISEKNLPFIFDRFWQADTSSKRKYQGVGIGLALVKELVELQDGRVTVESKEGQGTIFTIHLPCLPAETTGSIEQTSEAGDALPGPGGSADTKSEEWLTSLYRRAELFPGMTPAQEALRPVETWSNANSSRVLIADDEPDMLRFLKSQLNRQYQVLEAVDGQQAIDKACQFLPDLILLDMMMPEKDGLQACRELRQHTTTQSIPIIFLTARADDETKLQALQAGGSDFLAKPFSTTELHVRVKNLIELYDYQRKLAKQNQALERTIEQLKETETQLVESEKMRSLGRMSAGMIHEINNPLNFATTSLFTLRNKGKLLHEDHQTEYLEIVNDVEDGVRRVKELVSAMRGFSYADNQQLEWVDVSEVLTLALRFLSHEWKDQVEIHQEVAPGQTIWGNKNRLTQVVLNLLQNSLDSLRQKVFENEKPAIWITGSVDSERSSLIVRDNGTGIKSEDMDKIFDPFFTTKDVGQGMGLGLSICYRIVQDYQGRIQVKSEPGKFCEFALEFPVQKPLEPETAAEPQDRL